MRKWIILAFVVSCASAYSLDDLVGGLSNTTVTVKPGDEYQCVFGGYSDKGENTSNNTINVTGGTVTSVVGGSTSSYGRLQSGAASGNKINISGGTVDFVRGGTSYGSPFDDLLKLACDNEIVITGGTIGYIDGGNGDTAANNNKVTINGGTITGHTRAGYSQTGGASGNTVTINGGTVGDIEAVFISMSDIVNTNNAVIVNDGHVKGNITTTSGDSTNDRVEINGGKVDGNIGYGYYITDSKIAVKNSTVGGNIYLDGFSKNNSIEINNARIGGDVLVGKVYGYGQNDSITITNGIVSGEVYFLGSKGTMLVNGGELQKIVMHQSNSTLTINAVDKPIESIEYHRRYNDINTLNLNSGVTVNSLILRSGIEANRISGILDYQFHVPSNLAEDGSMITITGTASSDDIDVSDSTVSAFTDTGKLLDTRDKIVLIDKVSGTFDETFIDGVVEVGTVNILTRDSQLIATYGQTQGEKGEPGDKGETGDKGEQGDKGETGEKGQAGDKGETGDKGDAGEPGQQGDKGEAGDKGQTGDKGQVGDKGDSGDRGEQGDKGEAGDKGPTGDKGDTGDKGQTGDPGDCGCDTESKEDRLAKVVAEQTKTLTYSILGQIGLINQSTDMVINTGIDRALASLARVGQGNMSAFFATSIGRDRYKTGSQVYVNGVFTMAGIAYAPKNIDGFAVGVFGEFGNGQSDAFNASLTGNGDNEYTGGGILSRWNDILGSGIYLEATARMGRSKVDFVADGFLTNTSGGTRSVDYDMRENYYGAHLGIGKVIPLNDCTSLEVSAKYLWARQKGNDIVVAGESLKISDVDSHRIRAGARIRHNYNQKVSVFSGAWVENEFDGKASIIGASGKRYQGGSIKGTSGVGEVGVSIGSGRDSRWLLDLGVTGHIGRRRGITGNAGFSVSF